MAEFVGSVVGAATAKVLGFRSTDLRAKYHGIDGLFYHDDARRFLVMEAKGGKGRLAPGQMRDDWIRTRLQKLLDDNRSAADRGLLLDAINGRDSAMWAMVVSTDFSRSTSEYAAQVQTYPGTRAWGRPFE